jgi:nucleoid-associated protein YgaU
MLIGTVLCFAAIIWFCAKQQIINTPLMKFESQNYSPRLNTTADESTPTEQIIKTNQPQVQILDSALPEKNAETFIIHTVMPGQTLTEISKIYYNTPSGWKKIYEANKERLPQGPDTVKAGMKLTIPQ